MKQLSLLVLVILFYIVTMVNRLEADEKMSVLNEKERGIVMASAFAARGEQEALKEALRAGLEAGITVNEYKEVLVQVYAYCGFPRSLNALGTFMKLLEESGQEYPEGRLPGPPPEGKSIEYGTNNQTRLCGGPVTGPLFEFAPAIDEYLKSHLFGDIFARDNLDWRLRELATIAMLASMPGVEPQLKAHIAIGRKNGLTDAQVEAILDLVESTTSKAVPSGMFPTGKANTGFAQYFSGESYLAALTGNKELNVPIFNVTFEPGCRNNWHKHSGGQILIAVSGVGYYQERGEKSRRLLPGDVVEIPKDVEHWHGASAESWFSHLAVECNPASNKNTWLEPVTDADYKAATSDEVAQQATHVRLSKIRVEEEDLATYNTFLKEEIATSLALEPGVLTLYAVAEKEDPTRITIVEIYANESAYKNHIKTPHFRKYKEGTSKMVKELELIDVDPLLPGLKIK